MNEYKRAKDVKIDDVIFSCYNGKIEERKVYQIKKIKDSHGVIYKLNEDIYFKENSTKGRRITDRIIEHELFDRVTKFDFSLRDTIFFTDKRVATTQAVAYWNYRNDNEQATINKACESMKSISLIIAKLRFDEFEQPKTEE
jgi:hypothetical protein